MKRKHAIFDIEIIGKHDPKTFVGIKIKETKERIGLWCHQRGAIKRLQSIVDREDLTWVGFNSENFDRPVLSAILMEWTDEAIKELAETIIANEMRSWQTYREHKLDYIDLDHIDLIDVAPGVMISLKTYIGRMGRKHMVDMPFHHDHDLKPSEMKVVEDYCFNDIDGTEDLFDRLQDELSLRRELSEVHGVDLRSKSDAQIAEAILKKTCGLNNQRDKFIPTGIDYLTPEWIKTDDPVIQQMIDAIENHRFAVNHNNGSPEAPAFLEEPIQIGSGTYQMGIGGLHSTHDNKMHLEANDELLLSDFDVASYYPNIMMKAGLVPKLGGYKGELFLDAYQDIYNQRMEAKRAGNKKVANSLKITLNGTFGKLGNLYCSFYSPDLLLAVTLTGQLNLLCLISELERIKGVQVRSANTDGVLVAYKPAARTRVLGVFAKNAKRTGFEYEETPYRSYAAKDVNNYFAVKTDGSVKRKGLYTSNNPKENPLYLMKNPTMEVCSNAAAAFLANGTLPEDFIKKAKDIRDFVAIRNVQGGGIQFDKYKMVDDWELIEDHNSAKNVWRNGQGKTEKRKSRPHPYEVGVGGKPFGRVARWYMTTQEMPPLSYVKSGNRVPNTEGAQACLTLPDKLPADLNRQWYIDEAYRILSDCGVDFFD